MSWPPLHPLTLTHKHTRTWNNRSAMRGKINILLTANQIKKFFSENIPTFIVVFRHFYIRFLPPSSDIFIFKTTMKITTTTTTTVKSMIFAIYFHLTCFSRPLKICFNMYICLNNRLNVCVCVTRAPIYKTLSYIMNEWSNNTTNRYYEVYTQGTIKSISYTTINTDFHT